MPYLVSVDPADPLNPRILDVAYLNADLVYPFAVGDGIIICPSSNVNYWDCGSWEDEWGFLSIVSIDSQGDLRNELRTDRVEGTRYIDAGVISKDGYYYVCSNAFITGRAVEIWNAQDPFNCVRAGTLAAPGFKTAIADGMLYVLTGTALIVYDISNPTDRKSVV